MEIFRPWIRTGGYGGFRGEWVKYPPPPPQKKKKKMCIRLFYVSGFSFAGLWDSFLELRIRLQKALLVANKLPQQKQIEEFKSSGDKNLKDEYKQGTVS